MKTRFFFLYIFYSLIVSLSSCLLYADDQKQGSQDAFVLTKKQTKKIKGMSKEALKEHLGESTRDAFHYTTELASKVGSMQVLIADRKRYSQPERTEKQETRFLEASLNIHQKIGTLHIELASLQKHFSRIIENLIDNNASFKKAGKGPLSAAYKNMMSISQDLKKQLDQSKKTYEQLKQDKKGEVLAPMKQVADAGTQLTDKIKQIKNMLSQHECLKQV